MTNVIRQMKEDNYNVTNVISGLRHKDLSKHIIVRSILKSKPILYVKRVIDVSRLVHIYKGISRIYMPKSLSVALTVPLKQPSSLVWQIIWKSMEKKHTNAMNVISVPQQAQVSGNMLQYIRQRKILPANTVHIALETAAS